MSTRKYKKALPQDPSCYSPLEEGMTGLEHVNWDIIDSTDHKVAYNTHGSYSKILSKAVAEIKEQKQQEELEREASLKKNKAVGTKNINDFVTKQPSTKRMKK